MPKVDEKDFEVELSTAVDRFQVCWIETRDGDIFVGPIKCYRFSGNELPICLSPMIMVEKIGKRDWRSKGNKIASYRFSFIVEQIIGKTDQSVSVLTTEHDSITLSSLEDDVHRVSQLFDE